MPEHRVGKLKFYTFSMLDEFGIDHAMVTRHGGVSPVPWATLNLGATVGDSRENVNENMHRFLNSFYIDRDELFDVWQVHGNDIVMANRSRKVNEKHIKADAILTNKKGLALLMRFADCVPILLFDPNKKVIGIAHAGWKGTIRKVVGKTVLSMKQNYGSEPENIIAGIGPSIAGHHYEVGPEVTNEVIKIMGNHATDVLISRNGSIHLDLWKANQLLLEEAGISKIENIGLCTACRTDDWFSHRAESGKSGRFGVYIRL